MNRLFAVRTGAVATAAAVLFTGCAGVDLYSSPTLSETSKTGIPIYGSKPYLLVARTDAKEKPVEISIVYLPDKENIVYAVPRSGLGFAKTSLGLTNGQLTSFNQESDAKAAELLTSVAGLITARGTADKAGAEADAIRDKTLQSGTDTTKAAAAVQKVADEIKTSLKNEKSQIAVLTVTQKSRLDAVAVALDGAAKGLANLTETAKLQERLDTVKAQADELDKIVPGESLPPRPAAAQVVVKQWATDLRGVIKPVEPPKPAKPAFELYEIKQDKSGVSLVPVIDPAVSAKAAAIANEAAK